MAQLTHFVKQDFTARSRTVSVYTEETNYTVSWADLTGAGFAAGDEVGVILSLRSRASTNTTHAWIAPLRGSTFAGAAQYADSQRIESAATAADSGHAFLGLGQFALAENDNLYIATRADSTATVTNDDFTIFIFKVSDLGSANFQYAVTTPSGDASTSPTDGASVTLPAGDWLIFASTEWLDDSTTADAFMTILVGGSEVQRVSVQGEDTANVFNLGAMVYAPGLSADTVAKIQYWVGTGTTHDCDFTTVLAIRLDAFRNKWGVHSTNTITHTALGTYQECAGNGAFSPDVTGPVLALCFPKHVYSEAGKRPYGRIQVGGADWPAAGVGRTGVCVNGPAAAHQAPFLAGYGSLTQGNSYDFDFDVAEDADINPNYSCTQQDAVIFSLELASGGGQTYTDTVSLDALLQAALSRSTSLDAYLQQSIPVTLSLDALLQILGSRTAAMDALLNATGLTRTASLDGLLNRVGIATSHSDRKSVV